MWRRRRAIKLIGMDDRGPLRVMFLITSMPVGGAETLLVQLVRRLDREHFLPEICCLKEPGPLGEQMALEVPVHSRLIGNKYDVGVLRRLRELMQTRRCDAVITVGAGDKMFWGRLAAWYERVPVIASALHSTGWPDGIGWLNRRLTPITDAFIGVADAHGRHLIDRERFPSDKVWVIPNGIDTERFVPLLESRDVLRQRLGLAQHGPTVVIVAALRPEKNHTLFLRAAHIVCRAVPNANFVIVGDGPERSRLEQLADELQISQQVRFLGTRNDTHKILQASDLFVLTSDNEAAPVSIMEAMASGLPVVATRVGSVPEIVQHGTSGLLADAGNCAEISSHIIQLLNDYKMSYSFGLAGRNRIVQRGSLQGMVSGYERLIATIYESKARPEKPIGEGVAAPWRQSCEIDNLGETTTTETD